MRKIACLTILTLILLSNAFSADTDYTHYYRGMPVGATVGAYHDLSVETIYSSSESDSQGVPFDLASDTVSSGSGRIIASWTINSNYLPLTVSVDAEDLQFFGGDEKIPYGLRFSYSYPEFGEGTGSATSVDGYFLIGSDGFDNHEYGKNYTFSAMQEQGIHSIDMPIRIYIPQDKQNEIVNNGDSYPDGLYTATVTVKIEGEEL